MGVTGVTGKARADWDNRLNVTVVVAGSGLMSTTKLLETLLQIERSIGRADSRALRNMIMDAQGQVLRIQQEFVEMLREVRELRERQDAHLPATSWHAIAQAIAKHEEKKDAAKSVPALMMAEMGKRVS